MRNSCFGALEYTNVRKLAVSKLDNAYFASIGYLRDDAVNVHLHVLARRTMTHVD